MFKYWIKNRFLPDLAICVILFMLFSFAIILPLNNDCQSIGAKNGIYINSEIDYQIPNPSTEQLAEIKSQSFVNDVFGYYLTKTSVSGKSASKVNLLLSDTMNSIDFTMFNEKTKIAGIEKTSNYAFIDQTAADALSVGAGDTVKVSIAGNTLEYVVCVVYEENTLFDEGTVVVEFEGAIKDIYESSVSSKSYAAAFIHASDISGCEYYLKSYIPMGRLKDRSEFDNDESWELYNNTVKSGSYQNEITDFSENRVIANNNLENAKQKLIIIAYIGAAAIGLVYLIYNIIMRSRKSEKKYFRDILKNKSNIMSYRVLSFIFGVLVYFGCALALGKVFDYIGIVVLPLAVTFVFFVICLIMNLSQDKKYVGSKRHAK